MVPSLPRGLARRRERQGQALRFQIVAPKIAMLDFFKA
jgi:hypothetical protein